MKQVATASLRSLVTFEKMGVLAMGVAIKPNDHVASAGVESIRSRLDKARKQLLDLSTRNRLIHTPLDNARAKLIRVTDELSGQVFQLLARDKKTMSFLPGRDSKETAEELNGENRLFQPEDDSFDENGVATRHSDLRLQTAMASESLQKRLLGIYYDACTFEEEQGINVLYLALGFLEWYESTT